MLLKVLFLLLVAYCPTLFASEEIFKAWSKGRFDHAIKLCMASDQNFLAKTIRASWLLDPIYRGNYCATALDFLKKNPLWVQRSAIIRKGESLMQQWSVDDVVTWCSKYPPMSSKAHKLYALACVKKFGINENTKILLQKGWVYGSFTKDELQNYRESYGCVLGPSACQDRLTFLVVEENVKEIRDLLPLLNLDQRKKALQCISLLQKSAKAEQSFFLACSKGNVDGNLIYAFYKSRGLERGTLLSQKKLTHLYGAMQMLKTEQDSLIFWPRVKIALVHELLSYRKYLWAYHLLTANNYQGYNTQFLAGWIALNFLKKPAVALKHFFQMRQMATLPHSCSKSHYWIAKAFVALGCLAEANISFRKAGAFYSTFYGQLSLIFLGKDHFENLDNCGLVANKNFAKDDKEMLEVVCLLKKHFRYDIAKPLCRALFARLTKAQILYALELLQTSPQVFEGRYWNCRIGEYAEERGLVVSKYLYTDLGDLWNSKNINSSLVHAVVKQESAFNTRAVNSQNAQGMMQILPYTGVRLALRNGLKISSADLLNPQINLNVGSCLLRDLLKRYLGSDVLALASYNAGPKRVSEWIKRSGKLSEANTVPQVVEWIERIPFAGTKKYLQSVLADKCVYEALFTGDRKIRLNRYLIQSGMRPVGTP